MRKRSIDGSNLKIKKMTKKHFEAMAKFIASLYVGERHGEKITAKTIEQGLLDIMTQDNPHFNMLKWTNYVQKQIETIEQYKEAYQEEEARINA